MSWNENIEKTNDMSTIEVSPPISEYAIVVDPADNVAVVKKETFPNLELALPDGASIRLRATVPPAH